MRCGPRSPASWTTSTPAGSTPWNRPRRSWPRSPPRSTPPTTRLADGEGIEPYCATCGAWIGIFHGLTGWRHFRGDPAPGGQRELYEAGHPAAPAFCVPPGRALCPAQARTAGQALTDAITYRLERAGGGCADCEHGPAGACPDHVADTGRALAYRQLAAVLARALPEMTGEER